MKVTILKPLGGHPKGAVIDVTEGAGALLVGRGVAEAVEVKTKRTSATKDLGGTPPSP